MSGAEQFHSHPECQGLIQVPSDHMSQLTLLKKHTQNLNR